VITNSFLRNLFAKRYDGNDNRWMTFVAVFFQPLNRLFMYVGVWIQPIILFSHFNSNLTFDHTHNDEGCHYAHTLAQENIHI
jgi:hypothetical protein